MSHGEKLLRKPKMVHFDVSVTKVFAAYKFSFAISDHGRLYSWGKNEWCVLGHGDDKMRKKPKKLRTSFHFKHVSASNSLVVAVTRKNQLVNWGKPPSIKSQAYDRAMKKDALSKPKQMELVQSLKFTLAKAGTPFNIAITSNTEKNLFTFFHIIIQRRERSMNGEEPEKRVI